MYQNKVKQYLTSKLWKSNGRSRRTLDYNLNETTSSSKKQSFNFVDVE